MLFTSIQCPHAGCVNYNQSWSVEVGMKSFQFENPRPSSKPAWRWPEIPNDSPLLHIIGELKTSGFSVGQIAKKVGIGKSSVCVYMVKYARVQREKQKSRG